MGKQKRDNCLRKKRNSRKLIPIIKTTNVQSIRVSKGVSDRYALQDSKRGVYKVKRNTQSDPQCDNFIGFDVENEYIEPVMPFLATNHFLGAFRIPSSTALLLDSLEIPKERNSLSIQKTRIDSLNTGLFGKRYHLQSDREHNLLRESFINHSQTELYQTQFERRSKLPIYEFKDQILNIISSNPVCLITGNTGSGKSTQIPQILLEDMLLNRNSGSGLIICTQPRRVAATSISMQVSKERIEEFPDTVGYHIRFDKKVSDNTRIMYITTGMLFQYLQVNPTLAGVSHIILDEAHERSLDMEMLMALMKQLILKESNLIKFKLVIMSATLNSLALSEYFGTCPVLEVKKSLYNIHSMFLEDILKLPLHLPENFLKSSGKNSKLILADKLCHWIEEYSDDSNGSILIFLDGWGSISELRKSLETSPLTKKWKILPHHSMMKASEQQKVFEKYKGLRKIILSTNIAESSITIDDVEVVIDLCKMKECSYSYEEDDQHMRNTQVSKANLFQRRGRAGRVREGQCFHLISQTVFDELPDYPEADILHSELEYHSLQIKVLLEKLGMSLSIPDYFELCMIRPSEEKVSQSIQNLQLLDVVDSNQSVTALGFLLSRFPLPPKYAKIVMISCIFGCLDPVLSIISCLSVNHLFVLAMNDSEQKQIDSIRKQFASGAPLKSDYFPLMVILDQYCEAFENGCAEEFCDVNFLSYSSLEKARQFRDALKEDISQLVHSELRPNTSNVLNRNSFNFRIVNSALVYGLCSRAAVLKNMSVMGNLAFRKVQGETQTLQFKRDSELFSYQSHSRLHPSLIVFNEAIHFNASKSKYAKMSSLCSPLELIVSHFISTGVIPAFDSQTIAVSATASLSLDKSLPSEFWYICESLNNLIEHWSNGKLEIPSSMMEPIDHLLKVISHTDLHPTHCVN